MHDPKIIYPATHAHPELTRHMCRILGVSPQHTVLEPSAGAGGMVEVIQEFTTHITAIELNADLHRELQEKKIAEHTYRRDFLTVRAWNPHPAERNIPPELPLFDRIIMCPPKRSDEHIEHAGRFLRPGGKLMALVQEQNIDTRRWPYNRTDLHFQLGDQLIPCGTILLEKAL